MIHQAGTSQKVVSKPKLSINTLLLLGKAIKILGDSRISSETRKLSKADIFKWADYALNLSKHDGNEEETTEEIASDIEVYEYLFGADWDNVIRITLIFIEKLIQPITLDWKTLMQFVKTMKMKLKLRIANLIQESNEQMPRRLFQTFKVIQRQILTIYLELKFKDSKILTS